MNLYILWEPSKGELAEMLITTQGEVIEFNDSTFIKYTTRHGFVKAYTEAKIQAMLADGIAREA